MGRTSTDVPASSWARHRAQLVPPIAHDVVREGAKRAGLLVRFGDQPRLAQYHHRSVVDRVMKCRPGEDEPIDQRYGDAHLESRPERSQHAAGGRAVQVDRVSHARVARRDGVGLPVDDERDMADEAFVEDPVDRGAVEDAALRHPLEPGAIGDAEDGGRAAGHP